MIVWSSAFSSATSRPGLNRSICVACRAKTLAARVHHDQLGAALRRLLEEGRGDRVVFGRVRADDDDHVGIGRRGERRRHRARADPLHQRRDRRGVAEPRAVVDIVAAEAGAHQLLEQIGLLVRALGRAEPGRAPAARPGRGCASSPAAARSSASSQRRLAEMRPGVGRVDLGVVLGDAVLADQRLGQPVGVVDVVEAEAALDAEPVVVGRPVLALDRDDAVVLDLVGELAADAAIGADAVDLAVGRVGDRRRSRRPGSPASARRSGRPGRIRRRRRRCCCPSGRRNRRRSSRGGRAPAMPITSLTWTSRQARTQRLHWMQASSWTAIAGWLRSGAGAARRGKRLSLTPSASAHCQNREFGSCAAARAGWSPTSSSKTILRENLARSLAVLTFIPAAGLRMQEAASTRSPSISTMQARQLPSAR